MDWRVSDLIPSTTVESPTLAWNILSFLMMHTDGVVPAVLRSCICLYLGFQVVTKNEWRKIHSYVVCVYNPLCNNMEICTYTTTKTTSKYV